MGFTKRVFIFLTFFSLFHTPIHAEIKTYTHTVKQAFGGAQTPDDARIAAVAKAKREVLEMAGTYLESLTIIQDNRVAKDEIISIAAGVLNAEIISQKNYASQDAFGIEVVARVKVDTSGLETNMQDFLRDKDLQEKYERSQKRIKVLLARIDKLEEENRELKSLSSDVQANRKDEIKIKFKD